MSWVVANGYELPMDTSCQWIRVANGYDRRYTDQGVSNFPCLMSLTSDIKQITNNIFNQYSVFAIQYRIVICELKVLQHAPSSHVITCAIILHPVSDPSYHKEMFKLDLGCAILCNLATPGLLVPCTEGKGHPLQRL